MLSHFNAIRRKFIANFLLQVAPSKHILKITFTSNTIKPYFTVDGLRKVFYMQEYKMNIYERDYVKYYQPDVNVYERMLRDFKEIATSYFDESPPNLVNVKVTIY